LQLREKIIPEFERLHGPEYQALIMVDNSQGHAAYANDALLATKMNLNPGGAVPKLRDGWFMHNGCRISQPMVFPTDHPTHPNQPKGIKQVLNERGLWRQGLHLECKKPKICSIDSIDCCARRLLSQQPDFLEQKSSVQEVIEAAGHLCIFLPKFHCELNFIEFFWGAVKKYLREHCDYTFETLKANLPKALESVQLSTIRKWEHRMIRWMEAYRDGKSAKDAQFDVKKYGSRQYTSHRKALESVARRFDEPSTN
jgi:transposase